MPSVYVFQMMDTNLYKVGVTTKSVTDRLSACQTGNPLKLQIVAVIPVEDARDEREVHEMFAEKRLEGEWFSLDRDDIHNMINHLGNFYEIRRLVREGWNQSNKEKINESN